MGRYSERLARRLRQRLEAADHRLAACACLGCGQVLDAATVTDGKDVEPHEGAISLCWYCGHLQAFDAELKFRPLTDEEIVEIAGHPEIVLANTIRGPMKELYELRETMSDSEIAERIIVILRAMARADAGRDA